MASSPVTQESAALNSTEATFWLYNDPAGRIHPHEALSHYVVGGFHPTALGDTFKDGRYVIHRKLGFGGTSTVWLATDEGERNAQTGLSSGDSSKRNFVSIKIKSASSSKAGLDNDSEIVKLRTLESHYLDGPQNRSRTYVELLDWFVHNGPNGKHNCLITELLGPALRAVMYLYKEMEEALRPDTILRASRQLFEAVDFAHQAGLAHGDISAANVAFTCNALQNDEDEDFINSLSEPFVAKAIKPLPSPHIPKELIATSTWDLWEDGPAENIRLIDWGEAFSVNETIPLENIAQPLDLRAPETFFVGCFDFRHDFWRTGCVIYNLIYQESIFSVVSVDKHFFICKMTVKLGPLPDSWLSKFQEIRRTNKYADQDEANVQEELMTNTFEARCQAVVSAVNNAIANNQHERDEYTDYDLNSLSQLFQPMKDLLRYEPEMRITTKQASAMIEWVDHCREFSRRWQGEVSREQDNRQHEDCRESGAS